MASFDILVYKAVVMLGGVLFGSLLWYFFPRYGGVHWFRGPVPTIVIVEDEGEDQSSREKRKPFKGEAVEV
jgi:hypothetical protein